MNINLKRIPIEKVLFFDIETCRKTKDLDPTSKEFELYQYKLRNIDTGELPTEQETIEHYNKNAPLKLGYSKIVTIGLGFVRAGEVFIKALEGEESEILKEFFSITSQFDYLSGFNILAYDLPHCYINASKYFDFIEMVKDQHNIIGKKPWEMKSVIDLYDILKGTSYTSMSFDEALAHFSLESSKDDIKGSQVSEAWYNGQKDRVTDYVKKDVFQTINLFRKVRFEEEYQEYVDRSKKKEDTTKINPLHQIYNMNNITNEGKKTLKQIFSKKRLSKKDKEYVETVLKAVYIKDKIMEEDNKEIVENKIAEIKELIKEL